MCVGVPKNIQLTHWGKARVRFGGALMAATKRWGTRKGRTQKGKTPKSQEWSSSVWERLEGARAGPEKKAGCETTPPT